MTGTFSQNSRFQEALHIGAAKSNSTLGKDWCIYFVWENCIKMKSNMRFYDSEWGELGIEEQQMCLTRFQIFCFG